MKYIWVAILMALVLVSCSSADKLLGRLVDGDTALREKQSRSVVREENFRIIEGQKVLAQRMDLLTKEFSVQVQNFTSFNTIYQSYVRESNKFYIMTQKRFTNLNRRVSALEEKLLGRNRRRPVDPSRTLGNQLKIFGQEQRSN